MRFFRVSGFRGFGVSGFMFRGVWGVGLSSVEGFSMLWVRSGFDELGVCANLNTQGPYTPAQFQGLRNLPRRRAPHTRLPSSAKAFSTRLLNPQSKLINAVSYGFYHPYALLLPPLYPPLIPPLYPPLYPPGIPPLYPPLIPA